MVRICDTFPSVHSVGRAVWVSFITTTRPGDAVEVVGSRVDVLAEPSFLYPGHPLPPNVTAPPLRRQGTVTPTIIYGRSPFPKDKVIQRVRTEPVLPSHHHWAYNRWNDFLIQHKFVPRVMRSFHAPKKLVAGFLFELIRDFEWLPWLTVSRAGKCADENGKEPRAFPSALRVRRVECRGYLLQTRGGRGVKSLVVGCGLAGA